MVSRIPLLLLAAALIGCSSKVTEPIPNSATASSTTTDQQTSAPQSATVNHNGAIKKTVKDLEYQFSLESDYPTQTLEVTAFITSIGVRDPKLSVLLLSDSPALDQLCAFPMNELEAWARVCPGQQVTVHGKKDPSSFIDPFKWTIVSMQPNPAPIVTAVAFAEAFSNEPLATHLKYSDHWCYLTGNVVSSEKDDFNVIKITLDGGSGKPVLLTISNEFEVFGPFESGKPISALCLYNHLKNEWEPDKEYLEVDALPITIDFPVAGTTYVKDLPSAAERDAVAKAQMETAKTEFRLTAEELLKEFLRPEGLDEAHQNKVAEITGIVKNFSAHKDHPGIVFIDDGYDNETLRQKKILCGMLSVPWYDCVPGQQVTIKGRIVLTLDGFQCHDAILVKQEPSNPPVQSFTVSDLADQCLKDSDAFQNKWKDKWVVVSGTISSTDADAWEPGIELKSEGGELLNVALNGDYRVMSGIASMAPQDSIRLLARINEIDPGTHAVYLKDGWVLKNPK